MPHIAVIGAGSWGTAVAALAAHQHPVVLWARRPELAETINRSGENPDYLPGQRLPDGIHATSRLTEAVEGARLVVMGVPSHGFRTVASEMGPPDCPVISLTKGIEGSTLQTMTQVMAAEWPGRDQALTGVLTGPNLAREVIAGNPTAAVVAMADQEAAAQVQKIFMGPTFRVYTNPDVTGCELAGALKNVMAIAAGMSSGLGFGNNTLAALITRALAELTRLGVALGGNQTTFAGLAGMGDLIATCVSSQSRNHQVGFALARGRKLDDIVGEMKMVAEGVKTARAVLDLAAAAAVEMPIASQVARVLYEGLNPREAVLTLMSREARAE
jgi:glycerol-3-phosphate dehydrogenase (NAD(P)+)